MFTRYCAYILGIGNLFLATIAIVCVIQAEDHPEDFSLVYVAVSVFIFYMGTIIVIIILQIIETYQEKHCLRQQQHRNNHQSSLEIQIPIKVTEIVSQIHDILEENLTKSTERMKETPAQLRISRSQTLPLALSSYTEHRTPSISTSSSTLKDSKNDSNELNKNSSRLTLLLPKNQTIENTIHKNYQSFAFMTNDHRCLS